MGDVEGQFGARDARLPVLSVVELDLTSRSPEIGAEQLPQQRAPGDEAASVPLEPEARSSFELVVAEHVDVDVDDIEVRREHVDVGRLGRSQPTKRRWPNCGNRLHRRDARQRP